MLISNCGVPASIEPLREFELSSTYQDQLRPCCEEHGLNHLYKTYGTLGLPEVGYVNYMYSTLQDVAANTIARPGN